MIETCWQRNIDVYLPILHHFNKSLWFAQYLPDTPLYNNRFGIPEPLHSSTIRPWQLNWVLFPLVGFDSSGGRLGMGGGFYDRTFAHKNRWPKKPSLFGVAHECQKVEHIPLESWDISLDGVISNERIYNAKK
jgi:5-formyltetrahydrofolate cyclo-ligase